jgi:hypothetical protein
MKARKAHIALALLALFAAGTICLAEEEQKMGEAEAAYMAAGMPGEAHKFLEQMLGSWEVKITYWPAPGAEPVVNKGEAKREMVFDGRFLHTAYKGEFMGEEFIGLGYDGYDNLKKKYVGIWMDSVSTGIYYTEGELDDSGKVLTSHGEYVDPMTGKPKKNKSELTIDSQSMHTYVSWEKGEGGEWVKTMEVVYGKM